MKYLVIALLISSFSFGCGPEHPVDPNNPGDPTDTIPVDTMPMDTMVIDTPEYYTDEVEAIEGAYAGICYYYKRTFFQGVYTHTYDTLHHDSVMIRDIERLYYLSRWHYHIPYPAYGHDYLFSFDEQTFFSDSMSLGQTDPNSNTKALILSLDRSERSLETFFSNPEYLGPGYERDSCYYVKL